MTTQDFKAVRLDIFQITVVVHTVGGIAHICFKWFQITADRHPGVSWVSNDQNFFDKF